MSKTKTTTNNISTTRIEAGRYAVTTLTTPSHCYEVSKADSGRWVIEPPIGQHRAGYATLGKAKSAISEAHRDDPMFGGTSRTDSFNAKRAERIEAQGVNADNITDAAVGLTGYDEGECALCDHAIKWLFVLHLTTSDKGIVTFEPVGSTCIRTWAEALPLGAAQERILAAVARAEEEADALRARFRDINSLERQDKISEEQAAALIQFFASPASIRGSNFLSDVARNVFRQGGFVGRQWDAWSKALTRDIANLHAPKCGDCGSPTRARDGRWGAFYGCTDYPRCRWTRNIKWVRPKGTQDSDLEDHKAKASDPTAPTAPTPTPTTTPTTTTPRAYDGDDLPF